MTCKSRQLRTWRSLGLVLICFGLSYLLFHSTTNDPETPPSSAVDSKLLPADVPLPQQKDYITLPPLDRAAGETDSTCAPKNHFMFSKIEKTGSSTLYTVFQRYVKTNKLNLLVQTVGYHMNTSAPRGAKPGWDIGPRRDQLADAWIDHGAWNDTIVQNYMHKDSVLIACIREPYAWFKSATKYFDHTRKFSPDTLINTPVEVYRDRLEIATYLHLNQLLWLGFDYKQRKNVTAIQEHINLVAKRFDLVMLNDQFDASVLLMRKLLCWSYKDIFYKSALITGSKSQSMTDANKAKLLSAEVNLGEKMLYDHFNRSWWQRPEVKTVEFWEEVEYFKTLNQKVSSACRGVSSERPYQVPATKWHEKLNVTKQDCSLMTMAMIPMYISTAQYAIGNQYVKW